MSKEWRFTINLAPMGTPRPNHRFVQGGKTITYYPQKYVDYMDNVQHQLRKANALDETFYEVLDSYLGVKAEILFYVQAQKNQKKLNKLTRTTAPDIDNLLKAALDSIFKGLEVKDSCIVMVATAKFEELNNPRTEIVLKPIE